jgi:hypothetical protein
VSTLLPESLAAALAALSDWLRSADVPTVIVGGVAASLLGRPRLTRDIDALIDLPDREWGRILAAAGEFGIEPRIDHPLEFARQSRVIPLRHRASQIDIDVIVGALPFERDAVSSGRTRMFGQLEIRLPRVEDLMIMKAIAHRPRDLLDLEGLLVASPQADLVHVRRWVRVFANAATMPELIEDFDRMVAGNRSG